MLTLKTLIENLLNKKAKVFIISSNLLLESCWNLGKTYDKVIIWKG